MTANASEKFILRPSLSRILLIDFGLFGGATLLGLLSLAIRDRASLGSLWNESFIFLLAIVILVALWVSANHAWRWVIRLENGCIEGPISATATGGFALDRLDYKRTLASLKPGRIPWFKSGAILSMDGQRIIFQPAFYHPEDVEEFLRWLAPTPPPPGPPPNPRS